MTEFDELIKNKAEEAHYSYKPSAWKSFLAYSGAKTGSVVLWVATAAVAVSVVAVSTYFILRSQPQEQPTLPEPETIAVCVDTVQPALEEVGTVTPKKATPREEVVSVSDFTDGSETLVKETPSVDNVVPTTVPPTNNPRLEPVRINVDTITQMEPTEEELKNANSRLF